MKVIIFPRYSYTRWINSAWIFSFDISRVFLEHKKTILIRFRNDFLKKETLIDDCTKIYYWIFFLDLCDFILRMVEAND